MFIESMPRQARFTPKTPKAHRAQAAYGKARLERLKAKRARVNNPDSLRRLQKEIERLSAEIEESKKKGGKKSIRRKYFDTPFERKP